MTESNAKRLVEAINDCCYSPGGDPFWETLGPAAIIVKVLRSEGYGELISEGVIELLSGQNSGKDNYLEIKCKCGADGYDDHPCPYQIQKNNNKDFVCTCCETCIMSCNH